MSASPSRVSSRTAEAALAAPESQRRRLAAGAARITGSNNSRTSPKPRSRSTSPPRARSTDTPEAVVAAASRSAVLPIPGGPWRTSTPPSPARARASSARISASSASRSTSSSVTTRMVQRSADWRYQSLAGLLEPPAEQRLVDVVQAPESQRRHQPRRRLESARLVWNQLCPWNSPKVTYEL